MFELSNLLVFIKSVFSHWVPVMIAGVPPVIEVIYKKFTGNDLPFKFHIRWVVVAGALVALFLAWNGEYTEKLLLKQKEAEFNLGEKQLNHVRDDLRKAEKENVDLRLANGELMRDKKDLERKIEEIEKDLTGQITALKKATNSRKTEESEKARKKAMREKITSLLKEGEELKPDLTALMKHGDQWIAKVGAYLATLPDSSYKTEFAHPPIPPSYAYLMNTLYTNPAWIKVESHLIVLRKFLADLRE